MSRNDRTRRLIAVEDDGYRLSDTEIVDTCMLLFSDGVENVDSGLANIMLLLLEHPTVMAALIDDSALIPAALNESLRLNPPGQFISKIAKQPFEIHGRQIREHEAVILVLASANRDEAVFTQPDEFLPQRPENRHLSFGKGRHACIGAPLVEMEMAQAFTRLLSRLHDIRLADDHVEWQARLGHRWLARLPLRFETA